MSSRISVGKLTSAGIEAILRVEAELLSKWSSLPRSLFSRDGVVFYEEFPQLCALRIGLPCVDRVAA